MKKFKFILSLIFVIGLMLIQNIKVNALPSSFRRVQVGSPVYSGPSWHFPLQVGDGSPVICTGIQVDIASGVECTITNDWSTQIRAGVAAIIDKANSNFSSSSMTDEYFAATMAVNRFLYVKLGSEDNHVGDNPTITSSIKSLYDSYLSAAESAYNADYSSASVSLSPSGLTFTEEGDRYVSNVFSVNKSSGAMIIKANIGSVDSVGQNDFRIVVNKSLLSEGTNTIIATVTIEKQYSQARNYSCSGSQNVAYGQTETVSSKDSATISGTIRIETDVPEQPKKPTVVNILKVDENGNPLAGAVLQVKDSNGNVVDTWQTGTTAHQFNTNNLGTYYITEVSAPSGYETTTAQKTFVVSNDDMTVTIRFENYKEYVPNQTIVDVCKVDSSTNKILLGATLQVKNSNGVVVDSWTSDGSCHRLNSLPNGTYTLSEVSAPDGYVLNTEEKTFVISNDDKTIKLEMKNTPNKIQINKIDASTKKVLKGAELQIQDEKGNIVSDIDGNLLKWTTDGNPYVINKLKTGTYYIVETKVPDGYILAAKKKFVVSNSSTTIEITFENKPTRVEISKTNISNGQLLPGATLQIQDKDGKVIKEWKSEDKIHVEEGLKYGTYYLVEISAPEGFELNTEKVKFDINNSSEIVKVEMKNALLVEVPNTLSTRSTLLLCIAMIDIAIGIGIVTYVKKNKIKE